MDKASAYEAEIAGPSPVGDCRMRSSVIPLTIWKIK